MPAPRERERDVIDPQQLAGCGVRRRLHVEGVSALNNQQMLSLTNFRKAKLIGVVSAKEVTQVNFDVSVVKKCLEELPVAHPLAAALALAPALAPALVLRCAHIVTGYADQRSGRTR